MPNDINLNNLVINKMTKEQYQSLQDSNNINDNELYFITNDNDNKQLFHLGPFPPDDTSILWIDNSEGNGNGVISYHNGTEWIKISSVWS